MQFVSFGVVDIATDFLQERRIWQKLRQLKDTDKILHNVSALNLFQPELRLLFQQFSSWKW